MLIAGSILTGIGTLFCFLGLIFKLVGKSPYTAQTKGKVIGVCINAFGYNHGGSGNVSMFISSGGGTGYKCPIFEYVAGGVTYRRADPIAYSDQMAYKMIGQYRDVYYDPERPERASLSEHSVFGILGNVFLPVGAGLIILGGIFLLFR